MNNPWLFALFLIGTLCFGLPLVGVIRTLMRLLAALRSGSAKWPGPIVHESDLRVTLGRLNAGLQPHQLYSTFIAESTGHVGAFAFSLLMLLSSTTLFASYVSIRWTWEFLIVTLVVFIGGAIGSKRAVDRKKQVDILLADLASGAEPRQPDADSAEAEYAIEHPLLQQRLMGANGTKALILLSEGTKHIQAGNQQQALIPYQEAMTIDPSLHEHAREALSRMAHDCSPRAAGPIHYWLGVHSEYLRDLKQAAIWYDKAVQALSQMGYQNRESRARCNFGHVKMSLRDPSAMEEFEKAVALNPRNGTAHLNIARAYYLICEPGDHEYELALEAFANAIVADPPRYGPIVIASLRKIGYAWKEDLEKIMQRVESKRRK